MDIKKQLILISGKDKTADIHHLDFEGTKCNVTFNSSPKSYPYNRSNVEVFELKAEISPQQYLVITNSRRYSDYEYLLDFDQWYKIIFRDRVELYRKDQVKLMENCLANRVCHDRFDYFKSVAEATSIEIENGYNILAAQYNKISSVSKETTAADFLSDTHKIALLQSPELLIYPFGMNQSQKKAVENAFSSQISIIQGPPGTGKTQTILNIIANAVINNKTVAVVSNNNPATKNIVEKLQKKDLDFIAAFLGSRQNRATFMENQSGLYPPMHTWRIEAEELQPLRERIKELSEELNSRLSDKNRIAEIEQELLELKPEQQYFEEYYKGCKKVSVESKLNLSSVKILRLINEIEATAQTGKTPGLFFKLKILFSFGSSAMKLLSENSEAAIAFLQKLFYKKKEAELNAERTELEKNLKNYAFSEKSQELSEKSMALFRHSLVEKYGEKLHRPLFEEKDLKYRSDDFNKEYPVVLSTTYSIKNSLDKSHVYDYLIVDEASQVDLATGVLALSCARNVVIVGDLNQLANVIDPKDVTAAEGFWNSSFGEKYHFTTHSFLSSVSEVWKDAPSVLLREHYRCHPKIINFCNQKYYGGKLIIMTEDKGEEDTLTLYRCSENDHARGHSNQRQADIIENEILPALISSGYSDIGVIAPYNEQANLLRSQLPSFLEVDTVHKYQGREKQAIILSSVDNEITDFVDNYHMLNVAVSRAIKSLSVVVSHSCGNGNKNYDDLVRYIRYNNFQIIDSKTYSVFDLLYKECRTQRVEFLRKHRRISEYDSENLLYSVIEEILSEPRFGVIGCAVHVPLSMIIKDRSNLPDEEREFVECPLSHTDFLLFYKIDKSPLLAIEVDGTAFHAPGSVQSIRDEKKNNVFALCGLGLLRLRTDSSGEKDKITEALEAALKPYGS